MEKLWRARFGAGMVTIQKRGGRVFVIEPGTNPPFPGIEHDEARLDERLKHYFGGGQVESPYYSGEFHPRIWRGEESPTPEQAELQREWISTARATRMLYARLRDIFRCIEPARAQDSTYGFEQRELLMLASTEVESAWKSILVANGASAKQGKDKNGNERWTTEDYVRLLAPMRLAEWSVSLSTHPDYGVISPFASWNAAQATQSLVWYHAYNGTKHHRENHLPLATFANAVTAAAAAVVLTIAQFGESHLDRGRHFHADEFRIEAGPRWDLTEGYIRPLQDPLNIYEGWLGHPIWRPKPLF